MHRKRLLNQIGTTYGLFKAIRPEDLAETLKEYQNIDIKLDEKHDTILGYTIYDKSGFTFMERELGQSIRMEQRPDIFGNGDTPTEIDIDSKQFKLEIQKLIKEAFYTSYLKSIKPDGLLSENIATKNLIDIFPQIISSKTHIFLENYLPKDRKKLLSEALKREFPAVKERLYRLETKKEKEILESKFRLIGEVLEKGIFDVGMEKGSVRLLFQSLGLKYHDNRLSFTDSKRHTVPLVLGHLPIPNAMEEYVFTGFVRQNHSVLKVLTAKGADNCPKLNAYAIFLPMIFPKLYAAMELGFRRQFEKAALSTYLKYAEQMHAPYEKSPKDYIAFFNAKGFYFERTEKGFEIKSIFTDHKASCKLPKRTGLYLNSVTDLNKTLMGQRIVINALVKDGKNNLKNLWAGHLMERGMYDRVAFMLTEEKVYPNLHREMVQHHMEKGLRKSIIEISEHKTGFRQNRMLRKGVYAISALLGNRGKEQEEVYNGFKDELTDWSKYKSRGLSM